jgi:hypothetical protein
MMLLYRVERVEAVEKSQEFLDAQLDKRARSEGRSRSELIERACRFYLRHAPLITDEIPEPIQADGGKGKKK